jgi:Zn-dependent oligopeptidase
MCFEKFVFDASILSVLSKHYQTGECLPEDLRQNLVRARNSSDGRAWTG